MPPPSLRADTRGSSQRASLLPDLVFGLRFADGSRRCFMAEIDRGTMPVTRSNPAQTSFEKKMRLYLAAHAAGHHQRHFGWKTFRALTVTTDQNRLRSMTSALSKTRVPNSPGATLFLFTTRADLAERGPLARSWRDGAGRELSLA